MIVKHWYKNGSGYGERSNQIIGTRHRTWNFVIKLNVKNLFLSLQNQCIYPACNFYWFKSILILPFYIPVISLLCSFLLIKNKISLLDKFLIYFGNFSILVFTELLIRYTGINYQIRAIYILLPIVLIIISYFTLIYKFKKNYKIYE